MQITPTGYLMSGDYEIRALNLRHPLKFFNFGYNHQDACNPIHFHFT